MIFIIGMVNLGLCSFILDDFDLIVIFKFGVFGGFWLLDGVLFVVVRGKDGKIVLWKVYRSISIYVYK